MFPQIGIKKEFTIIPWDDPDSCKEGDPRYIRSAYLESPSIEKSYNFENEANKVRYFYCTERPSEREREETERERERERERDIRYMYACIYLYNYIYRERETGFT